MAFSRGQSRHAQLCLRYDINSSLLYHWKREYGRGKFNNEPSEEGAVPDRVEKLERLVGKLGLENEALERGWQHSLSRSQRNDRPSRNGDVSALPSGRVPGPARPIQL